MKKIGNKIRSIQRADTATLTVSLRYDDGSARQISLASVFATPRGLAAEVMRGNLFSRCYVENGALAWPNGLELCPDALLLLARRIQTKKAA
jgi:hypothetical protein